MIHSLFQKINMDTCAGLQLQVATMFFHWAQAYIKNNKVVVYSSDVQSPKAVRYAWGDNPGQLDLYTAKGLAGIAFQKLMTLN